MDLKYRPDFSFPPDSILWKAMFTDDTSWQDPLWHIPGDASLIVDLGCYAGLTTGCYAEAFPSATVIGIEMNPVTAERARRNLSQFGSRVEVITAAIGRPGKYTAHLRSVWPAQDSIAFSDSSREQVEVDVLSLDEVLEPWKDIEIDFLKIDIEGAERSVLSYRGEWTRRTKLIEVEVHGFGYEVPQACEDLRKMGFEILVEGSHTIGRRQDE